MRKILLILALANILPIHAADEFKVNLRKAQQGDAAAQYNVGLMYEKGQGVLQDNSLAAEWYTKSAKQGLAYAQ